MSRGNRQRWSLTFARWHRRTGIAAALFAIVLAVTGLLLQHASVLGLDRAGIGNAAVARWLGFGIDGLAAYRVDDRWLLGTGNGLWLDGQRIADIDAAPDGAAVTPFGLAVVTGGDLLLLESSGRLIERLRPGAGLPAPMHRIGHDAAGQVVLGGSAIWQPGTDWLSFRRRLETDVEWKNPQDPPALLAEQVRERALADAVTWQRLLLELHSGRIAGVAGTFIMDIAAFALLILAGSGLYLWWRRR